MSVWLKLLMKCEIVNNGTCDFVISVKFKIIELNLN